VMATIETTIKQEHIRENRWHAVSTASAPLPSYFTIDPPWILMMPNVFLF
jgi:hypothetical protein